jgi:hypothetical protein
MANLNQIPVPAQAVAILVEKVRKPAFLEKLARDWNIIPQTPADEVRLLELADLLRTEQAKEQVKQAEQGNPFLVSALDGLKAALGQEGINAGPTSQQQLLKQAAFQKTQEADVAHAALEYAQYLSVLSQAA